MIDHDTIQILINIKCFYLNYLHNHPLWEQILGGAGIYEPQASTAR